MEYRSELVVGPAGNSMTIHGMAIQFIPRAMTREQRAQWKSTARCGGATEIAGVDKVQTQEIGGCDYY